MGTAFLFLPETCVSSVRPCHNTRNFCEFCKIPIPLPGTCVTCIGLAQYLGYGYTLVATPGEPGILSGLTRRMHYALRRHIYVSSVTHTERQTARITIIAAVHVSFVCKARINEGHSGIETIHFHESN